MNKALKPYNFHTIGSINFYSGISVTLCRFIYDINQKCFFKFKLLKYKIILKLETTTLANEQYS